MRRSNPRQADPGWGIMATGDGKSTAEAVGVLLVAASMLASPSSAATPRACCAAAAGTADARVVVAPAAFGGTWVDLGPAPARNGQVEGIANAEVVGAVNAVATHPSDANILYAAAVNGGIWRTTNATAAAPLWTQQTDALTSLSVRALRFDPGDASAQTLVAGLLRTTNGGATWTVLGGGGTLDNRDIVAVEARGATLLAATDLGIYRSTNTGEFYIRVSGSSGSGLPAGRTTDLVGDPSNSTRLYTVLPGPGAVGVYRSGDTGATWAKSSDFTVEGVFSADGRVRIAVGASGQVLVLMADRTTRTHIRLHCWGPSSPILDGSFVPKLPIG